MFADLQGMLSPVALGQRFKWASRARRSNDIPRDIKLRLLPRSRGALPADDGRRPTKRESVSKILPCKSGPRPAPRASAPCTIVTRAASGHELDEVVSSSMKLITLTLTLTSMSSYGSLMKLQAADAHPTTLSALRSAAEKWRRSARLRPGPLRRRRATMPACSHPRHSLLPQIPPSSRPLPTDHWYGGLLLLERCHCPSRRCRAG